MATQANLTLRVTGLCLVCEVDAGRIDGLVQPGDEMRVIVAGVGAGLLQEENIGVGDTIEADVGYTRLGARRRRPLTLRFEGDEGRVELAADGAICKRGSLELVHFDNDASNHSLRRGTADESVSNECAEVGVSIVGE